MNEDPEKKARTEVAFREVNERIAENARRFGAREMSFICECDDPTCTERVEATIEQYERVRADATRFLVAPGHGDRTIETVVETRPHFVVVEKVEAVARSLARRLNPRTA
ncbi:MAG: hypothetical protein JOY72_02895 [Actinobacteria bacterium]|nr:hypothetical protein [Actinomycetota bacterium]MBV8479230.1 hypothetical protein [Actinomycetota bacterium]MBV8598672.1 hypothetical protein [Actinomycetota bacterium]